MAPFFPDKNFKNSLGFRVFFAIVALSKKFTMVAFSAT